MGEEVDFDEKEFGDELPEVRRVDSFIPKAETQAQVEEILNDPNLKHEDKYRAIIEYSQNKVLKMLPTIVDFCDDVLGDETINTRTKVTLASKLLDKIMPNFKETENTQNNGFNVFMGSPNANHPSLHKEVPEKAEAETIDV